MLFLPPRAVAVVRLYTSSGQTNRARLATGPRYGKSTHTRTLHPPRNTCCCTERAARLAPG
eukprot:6760446-Lingulodinium_polyedra.AAC.1